MNDLLTELESAPEGSRELSNKVLLACGWRRGVAFHHALFPPDHPGESGDWDDYETEYYNRHDRNLAAPDCTVRLDAALTLVPEGWGWDLVQGTANSIGIPRAHVWSGKKGDHRMIEGNAATPALALCIAALKARQADD